MFYKVSWTMGSSSLTVWFCSTFTFQQPTGMQLRIYPIFTWSFCMNLKLFKRVSFFSWLQNKEWSIIFRLNPSKLIFSKQERWFSRIPKQRSYKTAYCLSRFFF